MPFIKGLTLFFWAVANWRIPMLLILSTWRHMYRRFPLRYDPLYWGAVFPLGMPGLAVVASLFMIIALAAWTTTFVGMSRRMLTLRTLTPHPQAPDAGPPWNQISYQSPGTVPFAGLRSPVLCCADFYESPLPQAISQ